MAVPTGLITVAAFRKLPEDDGPAYHELRHGDVVAVTRPKLKHSIIQARLRDRIQAVAEPGSYVDSEVAFRPVPEYGLRVADLAYISAERFSDADLDDNISGAPDLVIEIVSPSNTFAELNEKEQLCLANGAQEFWIVDPKLRLVRVSTPDGHTVTYKSGQKIPLSLFGGTRLPVDEIFP